MNNAQGSGKSAEKAHYQLNMSDVLPREISWWDNVKQREIQLELKLKIS